jgi:hypothetical protein
MSIEVKYLGHLGNNLFQYALGRLLAEELGNELRCAAATEHPGWSRVERLSGIVDRLSSWSARFADAPQRIAGRRVDGAPLRYVFGETPGWGGHGINLPYVRREARSRPLVLHGYFQRSAYYHPHRERIRRWYRFPHRGTGPALGPRDLLVHLRQSPDMFVLDRAIDLGFYTALLAGMNFNRVYVCGLGLDRRVRAALAPFEPIYLDLPAPDTLELMSRAPRIVLANSTFSWWGAFLSDADEVIFPRPVRDVWSADRPEIDLEVPEARYRYIDDVPLSDWRPFERVHGATFGLRQAETGAIELIAGRPGAGTLRIPLPPELGAFATWLCARGDAFGPLDIAALDLPPALRLRAIKLVILLVQRDFVAAEPGVIEALAGFHGFKP